MPRMMTALDNLENRYALLRKEYKAGDRKTKLALDEPLQSLELVIFAAIREGWSKRTEQIKTFTESLQSAANEIRDLKQSIDRLVKAAQLAASTLKTLAAIRAAL